MPYCEAVQVSACRSDGAQQSAMAKMAVLSITQSLLDLASTQKSASAAFCSWPGAMARAKDINVVFAIWTDNASGRSRPMGDVVQDKGGSNASFDDVKKSSFRMS
jgi:hypothetical protein